MHGLRLVLVALLLVLALAWPLSALAQAPRALAAAPAVPEPVRLAPEIVAALARDWLAAHLGPGVDRASLELAGNVRELVVPHGTVSTAVSLQNGSVESGHVSVLVEATAVDPAGRRATRSTTVGFRVAARQDVAVAARELPRRAVVAAGDVRIERRAADRTPAGAVRELDQAIGKELVRSLAPGEALTASALATPRAIRRGAVVNLLLDGPGFRLSARGIASEDGAVGDTIRVVNQSSRRELVGRVENDQTVRVPF
jgi:flagella basal body P-ring formation protein FlgA